jgi:hypothetical protein
MKMAMVFRTPGELIEIDHRQERLDRMRAEFRDAQQRRYEKAALALAATTALATPAPTIGPKGSQESCREIRELQKVRGSDMGKEDRGFASMDRARRRDIASKGGTMAHVKGTAHQWTSEEARQAGRKGAISRRDRFKPAAEESPEVAER